MKAEGPGWRDTFSLPVAQGVYPVTKRTGAVLVRIRAARR
jgi:hypothetical protein